MANNHAQGSLIQADFFDNAGGLNNSDSPFRVTEGQTTYGYGYNYTSTGGIEKRYGHQVLNISGADARLRSIGYFLHNTTLSVKTLIRAADSKLLTVNTTSGSNTLVTDDTAAPSSTFFTSTQPVVFSQFNTSINNIAWMAGGGLASGTLLGYTGSNKATKNGSDPATGTITSSTGGTDGTLPAGTYFYAIALHKASTGALSNVDLDIPVTVGATEHVVIDFTALTGLDTTKYDKIYVYRSDKTPIGVSGFTVGDLAGITNSTDTSFTDLGAVQGSAENIPREGNVILDNSVLPSGTYKSITTWKRHLVTAQGSTFYISDLNKPESWPLTNVLTIPSGGDITGLAIVSFSTPTSNDNDEFLVIFKEREIWVFTGTTLDDWQLKFIDYIGCPVQSLIVTANGFLSWIDYRGIYLWDGSYKPIYCSRPIEDDFKVTGDLDKTKLTLGWGTFYRKQNEIIWYLSSINFGEQKLTLKLDVRLTYPQISQALAGRIMDGIFIKDVIPTPLYAGASTLPNSVEALYAGDNGGNTYTCFIDPNADMISSLTHWDNAYWDQDYWDNRINVPSPIPFVYRTKTLDLGSIGTAKRYHKIIVWCKESTTSNLTLNYWVNYQTDTLHKATQVQQIARNSTNALWDQGFWDSAYWDETSTSYVPVVFNLGNSSVGVDGDALTLEFVQSTLNSIVTIAGFSVIYSLIGLRK